MGSTLFNVSASRPSGGDLDPDTLDDREVVRVVVAAATDAIAQAHAARVPARYAFVSGTAPGVSRNRSLAAFRKNTAEHQRWLHADYPGATLGHLADLTQRYVDPRTPVLAFWSHDGVFLGGLGTFACHATALALDQATFAGDWPAVAAAHAERALGGVVMLGLSGAGDVTPLPPADTSTYGQGPRARAGARAFRR